jgi:hypothetical protein
LHPARPRARYRQTCRYRPGASDPAAVMGRRADGDRPGNTPQCGAQGSRTAVQTWCRRPRRSTRRRTRSIERTDRVATGGAPGWRGATTTPSGGTSWSSRPGAREGRDIAGGTRSCASSAVLAILRARVVTAETKAANLEVDQPADRHRRGHPDVPVTGHRGPGFRRPPQAQPGPQREGAGPCRGGHLHRKPLTARPSWGHRLGR